MRIKFYLTLTAALLVNSLLIAQTHVLPPVRPYNVISYNLTLDWRNVFHNHTPVFSGRNQIQVSITSHTASIVLDASEMTIDSVWLNGSKVAPSPIVHDSFSIPLPLAKQDSGASNSLDIYYTHSYTGLDPASGMYYYTKGQPANIPEDLAYTMSEPDGARKWMPCNDEPYSKSASSISIIVPAGYSAQSNGILLSTDTDQTDNSLTFHWQSDRPIATYLMVAYASKWVTWRDYYHRLSNPNDSVPIIYYAWQEDYDNLDTSNGKLSARVSLQNTPSLVKLFSGLFGEYPFTQYSQVPLQPCPFGGMEHQTITALDRGLLNGLYENLIAHELLHHWFGDKTTCETWADIWLNEGFATFGEMLWAQQFGQTSYDDYVRGIAGSYFFGNIQEPTYNPPVDSMFSWPYVAVVYYKPACVLHMLRRAMNNDTLFFHTLRDYSSAFAYTTANTFQFRDFIAARDSAVAPMDLKEFIDEWIFQPDYPLYDIRWGQFGNKLVVQVDQSQSVTDHYTMPLRFLAIAGSDTTNLVFLNNQRSQSFSTTLSGPISDLVFDTSAVIISHVNVTRDQNLSVSPSGTIVWPLEAMADAESVKLSFAPIVSEGAVLRIMDVLGRTVYEAHLTPGIERSDIIASNFPNGDYFVTLSEGTSFQSAKFHIAR